MRILNRMLLSAVLLGGMAGWVSAQSTVIVVQGAGGETEFAADFDQQIKAWMEVSAKAGAKHIAIGTGSGEGPLTDRDRLQQALAAEEKAGLAELWLVLVGHGTFDGREAKMNLRGPDVTAAELADWLKPFQRPLAVLHTTSSSAPFLAKLSAPGRVVVSATRSGYEHNYARFGKFLAEAIVDPKSDLDKDGQISLLESFLSASHRTTEFYKTESRLATEHALIDDNGDGLGTPADWFRGVVATKRARDGAALDGPRAHQMHLVRSAAEQLLSPEIRARRDRLELQVAELRARKAKMPEKQYFEDLEKLLLELAALYDGT
ncbi:MAG: hypothetical protein HZC55_09490 [Verrucomicrobia bacterium]|nr:hypothetical protein [Verrucomicrobiota bacterium]